APSAAGPQRIVKLYRHGIEGDAELLNKVAQANSAQIVHIFEHGVADGVRFEVMEYYALGSLRYLLQQGPMSVDRIRDMVAELASGLSQVQALHILHRDLKPENVLVRSLQPLALVLTDFGIASLRMATQHFTNGARTTRYAPPEALTGVLDDKADWWSLGMMVLEATLGRHPFEGLNEQVANYQLATKPVDTRVVFHDDLRKLCRGLLLRDPKRRWGVAEVQRWLANDPTLTAPEDSGNSIALHPYNVADALCTTAVELAATLAKNWEIGCKDVVRGSVAAWVDSELHDQNLLRTLQDIADMRGVSADWRLLSFILAAAPDIPAVWQGQAISRQSLLVAARKSSMGDAQARAWLQSIHSQKVLELLAGAGRTEVISFRESWLLGLQRFEDVWNKAREAEDRWSRAPKAWHGRSGVVVDVDYALYVQPMRMAVPPTDRQHGPVLLAINLPAYANVARAEVVQVLAQHDAPCPWLDAMGELHTLDGVGVMVIQQLLPLALQDMERETKHMASATDAGQAGTGSAETVSSTAMVEVRAVLELARLGADNEAQAAVLLAALDPARDACLRVIRTPTVSPEATSFRNAVESLSRAGLDLEAALNSLLDVRKVNAIWLEPQRLGIGAGICAFVGMFVTTGWLVTGLLVLGGGAAWRLQLKRSAQKTVEAKLKSFIRFGDRVMSKK
ncbi:MAG: protein kinase, partial [Rhodoferax sp.]